MVECVLKDISVDCNLAWACSLQGVTVLPGTSPVGEPPNGKESKHYLLTKETSPLAQFSHVFSDQKVLSESDRYSVTPCLLKCTFSFQENGV